MKRVLIILFSVLLLCVLLLVGVLIHVDKTEWTLRSKVYDVSIPITVSSGTIAEIEEQARIEALKEYSNAYLGKIDLSASSISDFRFSDGEIEFTYCENLGSKNGYYSYDRYALCVITVDLSTRQINKIDIYGNNQLGGLAEVNSYSEFQEIEVSLHESEHLMRIQEDYEITWYSVSIYATHTRVRFGYRSGGVNKGFSGRIEDGILIIDSDI